MRVCCTSAKLQMATRSSGGFAYPTLALPAQVSPRMPGTPMHEVACDLPTRFAQPTGTTRSDTIQPPTACPLGCFGSNDLGLRPYCAADLTLEPMFLIRLTVESLRSFCNFSRAVSTAAF